MAGGLSAQRWSGGSSLKNTTNSWKPGGEKEQGFGRLDLDCERRLTVPDRMCFECTEYDAEVSRSAAVGSKQMDFAGNWLHLGIKGKKSLEMKLCNFAIW